LERFGYSDGIKSHGRFASREKPVLSRKVPEISSSPLRPDTHAPVRRLGSSYKRDVSMPKTSHDACQIARIGWAWEWGLGC
jgi:hypothetical protein